MHNFIAISNFKSHLFILVRLVDGGSSLGGRIEVHYNGRWGTVCSDGGWNDKGASLVCAQLGFGPSGEAANFGPGAGTILMEIVKCSFNDTFPASCMRYGVGITVGCDHSNDIGVKCNGMCIKL